MESMQGLCAIRGNLVYAPALGQLTTLSPGYIITRDAWWKACWTDFHPIGAARW